MSVFVCIYVHICFHSAFHPYILCSYQHMYVLTDVCGGIIDCVLRFLHKMCEKQSIRSFSLFTPNLPPLCPLAL